ncbi:unnamed protein product [Caenorhabditis sp. 36 PRJEB53466]|nr:unnamed protein product [Caenorhabditis sp. 36 PRJEB53466]
MELREPPFTGNKQILIWSSTLESADGIAITAEHPKSKLLQEHTGRPVLEIFPQKPYEDSHEIVTCMSPISNDFELVLSALTASISMGSFVVVPFEELNGEFYKFLKMFEHSGNVRLHAHPILRHSPRMTKTNAHAKMLKLKSDLAQLFCFQMYNARSKFLIFQNADNIVLPILSSSGDFSNYSREFHALFELPRVAGHGILEYNARISIEKRFGDFEDFSVQNAIETAKIEVLSGNSKVLVMKANQGDVKSHAKMYNLRNSDRRKISPKIMEKIEETMEKAEESDAFWTLIKNYKLEI